MTADLDSARKELIRQRLTGQRLWFLTMLSPDSAEYQVPIVPRVREGLDLAALRAAYEQVLARHEILRTRYQLRDARPVQVIDEPGPADVTVTDLAELPASQREARAVEFARADIGTPFNLGLGYPDPAACAPAGS